MAGGMHGRGPGVHGRAGDVWQDACVMGGGVRGQNDRCV